MTTTVPTMMTMSQNSPVMTRSRTLRIIPLEVA